MLPNDSSIPLGICQCGCGQATRISDRSSALSGYVRGQPHRFIQSHGKFIGTKEQRFWSHVPERPAVGCWLWTGTLDKRGYGRFAWKRRLYKSHRVAYALAGGVLTSTDKALHTCDVRPCVRNDEIGTYEVRGDILPRFGHIFKGTNAINNADKMAKGRNRPLFGDDNGARKHPERMPHGDRHGSFLHPERLPRGEAHGRAILTTADVLEIRTRAAAGESYSAIAQTKNTTKCNIGFIVRRRTWKHL